MMLEKYLDSFYLELVYDSYKEEYIMNLDADNFDKVYCLLQEKGFYFINDIILRYLEIFELEPKFIENVLEELKQELGSNYIYEIGRNMTLLDRVMEKFLEEDE